MNHHREDDVVPVGRSCIYFDAVILTGCLCLSTEMDISVSLGQYWLASMPSTLHFSDLIEDDDGCEKRGLSRLRFVG
jgi:hypothetical protein